MEASNGPSKHALMLIFGLPILQTAIVCASMYAGHVLTKRQDRQQAIQSAQAAKANLPVVSTNAERRPVPGVITASAPVPIPVHERVIAVETRASAPAAPSIPAIPAVTTAKPADKPELVSMQRAVERLTPATPATTAKPAASMDIATKPVEKPKAFARPAPQKPVLIPLARPAEKAAVPTPLMVPAKEAAPKTSGTSAIQIEADETPARAQIRETRPVQKQEPIAEVKVEPKSAPKAAPVEVAAAPIALPTPAVTANKAPAHAEVVSLPEPSVEGDVAAVEPVRRAPVVAPRPVEPAPQPVQPAQPVRPTAQLTAPVSAPSIAAANTNDIRSNEGRMILASAPAAPANPHSNLLLGRPVRDEDLCLEQFYALMSKYVDAYSVKKGLNPAEENKRWMKRWMDNVEQAMNDGDSSEQQFINRVTIAKRDCFNIEKAEVSKVVEGCRILLRYRDGGFTWLSAMREALTRENLKKTLLFLNAGPQI